MLFIYYCLDALLPSCSGTLLASCVAPHPTPHPFLLCHCL